MEVKWKILKENFGTDNCVAILKNKFGTDVLYVHEDRWGHRSDPTQHYPFFSTEFISYADELEYVKEHFPDALEDDNLLFEKSLEYACSVFENEIQEKASKMLYLLS